MIPVCSVHCHDCPRSRPLPPLLRLGGQGSQISCRLARSVSTAEASTYRLNLYNCRPQTVGCRVPVLTKQIKCHQVRTFSTPHLDSLLDVKIKTTKPLRLHTWLCVVLRSCRIMQRCRRHCRHWRPAPTGHAGAVLWLSAQHQTSKYCQLLGFIHHIG